MTEGQKAAFAAGRRQGLEEAARLIRGFQVSHGASGAILTARYEGNCDGLPYVDGIIALADCEAADLIFWKAAAKSMLDAWDDYSAAKTESERENIRHVLLAAAFAAAAIEDVRIFDLDAVPRVIIRTFMRALIDPMDPELDYLRAYNRDAAVSGGCDVG